MALGFAARCTIWGEFPNAAKLSIEGLPPMLVVCVRVLITGLILSTAAHLRGAGLRLDRGHLGVLFLIALSMIAIPSAAFFWAVQHAQASVLTCAFPASSGLVRVNE